MATETETAAMRPASRYQEQDEEILASLPQLPQILDINHAYTEQAVSNVLKTIFPLTTKTPRHTITLTLSMYIKPICRALIHDPPVFKILLP
jgi:hypothetical protein